METLKPKLNGDWLIERNEVFNTLIPLAGDTHKKFGDHCEDSVFVGYSNGYKTNRDAWCYNYSKKSVCENMSRMIEEYNFQTESGYIEYNSEKIAWTAGLEFLSKKKKKVFFNEKMIHPASYRPYSKHYFYHGEDSNRKKITK